jgi:hypothetical protein
MVNYHRDQQQHIGLPVVRDAPSQTFAMHFPGRSSCRSHSHSSFAAISVLYHETFHEFSNTRYHSFGKMATGFLGFFHQKNIFLFSYFFLIQESCQSISFSPHMNGFPSYT